MKTAKIAIAMISCMVLFGCASGAKMGNMVYQGEQKIYPEELKSSIDVSSVSGGKETNPAWSSNISNEAFIGAVKNSLISQGLYSDDGKYKLEVNITGIDKPFIGLDMTVKTFVRYTLTDSKSQLVVFDETIIAEHTATMGDSLIGIKRLRLANEGSGRRNIEIFLGKLSGLNIKTNEISLLLQ